jgi:tectonin beta-propeller repeat-containing protein 1
MEDVRLPTLAWMWDEDWHIEMDFKGSHLALGGWTYAIDFPAEYYPKKGLTSCVRRRKWVRHRRYVATNSWSAVPGIHKDMSEEPFVDIRYGNDRFDRILQNSRSCTVNSYR